MRALVALSVLLAGLTWAGPSAQPAATPSTEDDPRAPIIEALAAAVTIPKQAQALVELAWPTDPAKRDSRVQVAARQELVQFGEAGMPALREALQSVPDLYRADVVAAIIESRRRMTTGLPKDFLPALDEAIWYGSAEAKRLAMAEAARFRYRPAVLTILDAVAEHPGLRRTAMQALAQIGDDHARKFLGESLYDGSPEERPLAAVALAAIGGRARQVLREATRSAEPGIRSAAMEALLPGAGLEDLTVLHEYVGSHADDDPELVGRARERASFLEELVEQQGTQDEGPGPAPDF